MKRLALVVLVALVATPAFGLTAQRGARRGLARAGRLAGEVQPAQVWRLTTLSLEQRRGLQELQASVLRELRDADGGPRERRGELREQARALRALRDRIARVVTPEQLEAARSRPRGPLAPEELIYYPVTSLADLDPARRAKIDAVLAPAVERARAEAARSGGWGRRRAGGESAEAAAERERRQDGERRRRAAYYEVLEALLTTEQMAAVNGFLPEQLRKLALKERVVYRLPSLTLEQEARARAIFAALEDETAADRARLKAIGGELRDGGAAGGRRELAEERRAVRERVDARERAAYDELAKVLGPEQMKELRAQRPGPPRPTVFAPEAVRRLSLAPEQRRRIGEALAAFQRATRDERTELRELRAAAKGADFMSLEMAETRDRLRRAAEVVDDERERLTRTVADILTGEQLARLVEIGLESRDR